MEVQVFNDGEYDFERYLKDLSNQIDTIKDHKDDIKTRINNLDYGVYLVFLCIDEILNELDFNGIETSENHKEYNLITNKKHSTNSNLILRFYEQKATQRLPLSKEYNFHISAHHELLDSKINIDFSYLPDDSEHSGIRVDIDGTSEEFEFQTLAELPNTIRAVQKYLKEKMYQLKKEEILKRVERGFKLMRKNPQETSNTPSNSSTDSTK